MFWVGIIVLTNLPFLSWWFPTFSVLVGYGIVPGKGINQAMGSYIKTYCWWQPEIRREKPVEGTVVYPILYDGKTWHPETGGWWPDLFIFVVCQSPGLKEHLKELVPWSSKIWRWRCPGSVFTESWRMFCVDFNWGHLLRVLVEEFFLRDLPYSWLICNQLISWPKRRSSKQMVEEFGGIFLLKEVLISTLFPESVSDLFFYLEGEKPRKITGISSPKIVSCWFFFFGWLLRPATEVDRSFARWGEFEETRAFFLAEFWVLSFEFWLCVVSFLFAEKKTQLMVNLLVWGPVVWIRAGIF